MEYQILDISLNLFEGEGGGGAAEGAAGADGATGAHGSDGETTETQVTASTTEDRRAAFKELINGEYRNEFREAASQNFDARFKEAKGNQERLNSLQPILNALASKYGVDVKDVAKLQQAIDEDDSYYAEEAEQKGLTVGQLKEFKRMEAENEQFRAMQEQREREESANKIYAQWQQQSEDCAQTYPGFDLRAECASPETGEQFVRMLKSGVDVKHAFEVIHKDELLSGAIRYAAQTAQKRTVDSIRARGLRPAENGASGSASARLSQGTINQSTREQREQISRRVLRGERITLQGDR